MDFVPWLVVGGVAFVFVVAVIKSAVFTIHTKQAAIVDGLRESVLNFEEGVHGVDPHEVMALLMMTQYFDALRDIGAQSNTILLPHSPAAVSDLYAQLRTAITAGNVAAIKSTEQPPPKK